MALLVTLTQRKIQIDSGLQDTCNENNNTFHESF